MASFRKIALVIFLLVTVLFVGFFGYAMTLPSEWKVERSVTLQTTPQALWPIVADLRGWERWVPWDREKDETLHRTIEGEMGVGQRMLWRGDRMGVGNITVSEIDEPRAIRYMLRFQGVDNPSRGAILLSDAGDGRTTVTWTDAGDMGRSFIGRYFIPHLEAMVGADFDEGLGRLSKLIEREASGGAE